MLSGTLHRYYNIIFSMVTVTVFAFGCATPIRDIQKDPDATLQNYEILTVHVYTQSEDINSPFVQQMEQWIMSKLRERNLTKKTFKKIYATASPVTHAPYVKMTVKLIEVKRPSPFQRWLGPPLVGESTMIAEVQLTNGASGEILSQGTIGGKTTSGFNFEAVELAAEEIANFAILR